MKAPLRAAAARPAEVGAVQTTNPALKSTATPMKDKKFKLIEKDKTRRLF